MYIIFDLFLLVYIEYIIELLKNYFVIDRKIINYRFINSFVLKSEDGYLVAKISIWLE